jgi:hypothetical protein
MPISTRIGLDSLQDEETRRRLGIQKRSRDAAESKQLMHFRHFDRSFLTDLIVDTSYHHGDLGFASSAIALDHKREAAALTHLTNVPD